MKSPTPRPGIMDIAPYVPGEAAIAGVAEPTKLSSNESALGPSPRAMEVYRAEAAELHRYPDGGATKLRAALGKHYGLDPARLVCGAGSDELISLLVRAYAGPGDEVLFSQHGFLMYRLAALSVGATPVTAPEKNLTADVDAILARLTPRTKLVFLANPNNPTGTMLPASEVRRLHQALPAHVVFGIDAAYAEYVVRNDYSAGAELVDDPRGNAVMLRTFSKIFGLAALRLGWAYCPPGIADVLNRLRGPFNVGLPSQSAGIAALADVAHTDAARSHNDVWRPWVEREISTLGFPVVPSVGNFVLIRFPKGAAQAKAADEHLKKAGIILRGMAAYGLPDSLRMTVGTEAENKATVAALAAFAKSHG
jgi:histidinol-phosphate aminotransferase